jgi:hypothetical protein
MAEFPPSTPSPARVHERARALVGHHPVWTSRPYAGGLYAIAHFRICSWCGCIHAGDLIDLLLAGRSSFESTAKPGKFLVRTPNPIAGDLVRMGSIPGRIFERGHEPVDLRQRLIAPAKRRLMFRPSTAERLSGHFDRPALEIAPTMIVWPFYAEHTNDRQWPEIWAAASRGAQDAESSPSA